MMSHVWEFRNEDRVGTLIEKFYHLEKLSNTHFDKCNLMHSYSCFVELCKRGKYKYMVTIGN